MVVAQGTGPYVYQWYQNGSSVASSNSSVIHFTNLSASNAGSFEVVVTGACNSDTSTIALVAVNDVQVSSMVTPIVCHGDMTTVLVSAMGGSAPYTGIGTFTVAAGTYTYTITDSIGCSTTDTVVVTEPAALASSQSLEVCAGEGVTVGSSTYTSSGVYTDVLQSGEGCDSTVTTTLVVKDSIDVALSVSGNTISVNEIGAVYQWIDCENSMVIGNAVQQDYTPTVSGSYAVVVTVDGCTDTSLCQDITIVGIGTTPSHMISAYPNPSQGLFSIQVMRSGDYMLVNQVGQVVERFYFQVGETNSISVNRGAGIYYLLGQSNGMELRERLVVTQ